ncbi:electron transport complex subunit RsxC [Pistricoccus aurantiacus]|uniref:electron transport complex subunit RsxC n=1 Tax=Pistricoccus aurantiacus TaxID=1883414 RepID=UPI003645D237
MAKAFDFPGGVHPPQHKTLSNQTPLIQAPLPRRVVLPLAQHIGQPAEPCVKVGDMVKTGQVIASAVGLISADLHASITGEVVAIEERPVPHPSQGKAPCILIEGDGVTDEWETLSPLDWNQSSHDDLIERLARSGVVGLGGAGFPTQIKARVGEHHVIETLIVNAAECEPYITADDLTLRTYPVKVLEGAELLARLCGAERILVGIEDNKPAAIEALEVALADRRGDLPIELKVIATRYPSGGEKQLIKRLLDREVPSGGLPADIGVLCHNPGTLLAALRAVRDGRPLVSRITTLTGEALARPGNVEARLGTSMAELLTFAGLDTAQLSRLIMGGPMMGFELTSLDLPLVKATNCLIAASARELPPPTPERPCIRCGACEAACPVALLPQQLYWFAKAREHDKAGLFHLFDCIECGACDYVCPSHIPLVQYYRAAKDAIRAQALEARRAEHARHRFELRQARLEREAQEKAAKRAARAKATSRIAKQSDKNEATSGLEDIKTLRIAQAAAKAALRKAEKALARAAESGDGNLEDLEVQLATARENLQAIQARMEAARESAS